MVRLLNNFTLVCKGGELCSCDFRINIYDCPHSEFYVIAGKIFATICILVTIMAVGFLIFLVKVKKQSFFLSASEERGWIRPRPLHSYQLILICYMLPEALHLIALINELYPSITAAEVGGIVMNVATASAATLYTVSIVYSTPNVKFNESYEISSSQYGPNKRFVDTVGILLFLLPIVAWFPLAVLTGNSAERNDIEKANYYFTAHYVAFIIWEVIYVVVIAYFWRKLMIVIKGYIIMIEERNVSSEATISSHKESIRKSSRNITLPVMAIIGGLLFQATIFLIMILTYRNNTIHYFGWNVFYYWIQYVTFPLLGLSVESVLFYYAIPQFKNSRSSSGLLKSSQNSSAAGNTQNSSAIEDNSQVSYNV